MTIKSDVTTIHPLSPERLPDFLGYFDGEAFADNPKWSFCYCQFLYVDHNKVRWSTRTAVENRAAACDRICNKTMQGYLAYRGGRVIGWCSAAPRIMMAAFSDEADVDAARIGQIGCFVVAAPYRKSGVATLLLNAACAGLQSQGLTIAEACPVLEPRNDAQNHFGPLSMYVKAGFREHRRDDDGHVYVRRGLA